MMTSLSMQWLPVADENGRAHMEAVWVSGDQPRNARAVAHAA